MKLGISLSRYYEPGASAPLQKTIDLAVIAEEAGFDIGAVGHRSFEPDSASHPAPFVMLAAIAARTSRIKLAPSVYLLPLHHPIAVAEQLATLDQVSCGRAIFGVGTGYMPPEFAGFGVDPRERGERTDEALKIIRDGFASGFFEHAGKYFNIPRSPVSPIPVQTPHPPIWVGGMSKAAIRRAANLGDGWITDNLQTVPEVVEHTKTYRALCAEAGRTPGSVCVIRFGAVAPTRAELEREWLPQAINFQLRIRGRFRAAGDAVNETDEIYTHLEAGKSVGLQEFVQDRAIAGTPDDCIEQLKRWEQTTGCDSVIIALPHSYSFEEKKRALQLFGREVIPAL